MAERRLVEPRPHAAPVGHDEDHAPLRRQHAPHLAQQLPRAVGDFEAVHGKQPVDRSVGERQAVVVDQHAVRGVHRAASARRPGCPASARRGAAPRRERRRDTARRSRARSASSDAGRASARGCDASAAGAPSARAASRRTRADRRRRAAWTRLSCYFARQSDRFARHFKPSVPIRSSPYVALSLGERAATLARRRRSPRNRADTHAEARNRAVCLPFRQLRGADPRPGGGRHGVDRCARRQGDPGAAQGQGLEARRIFSSPTTTATTPAATCSSRRRRVARSSARQRRPSAFPASTARWPKAMSSQFGNFEIKVLETPGHTLGHVSLLHPGGQGRLRRRHAVRHGRGAHLRGQRRDDVEVAAEDHAAADGHGNLLRARVHAVERPLRADAGARTTRRWSTAPRRSTGCARRTSRRCRRGSTASWRPTPSCARTSPPSGPSSACCMRPIGTCSRPSASARTRADGDERAQRRGRHPPSSISSRIPKAGTIARRFATIAATERAPHRRRSISCSRPARSRAGIASMPPRSGTGMPARRWRCRSRRPTACAADIRLGADLAAGERPQGVVPPGYWQSAHSLGAWTLVGCTVAPGFVFEKFELAPEGFAPPRR